MKCPICGTENDVKQNRCKKCNLPLAQSKDKGIGRTNGSASTATAFSPTDVARRYKNDYSRVSNDQTERSIESIQELCELIMKPKVGSKELVESVIKMIFRQFHIKEVSIGLRSASDGRYRYVAMQGMRANVWAEHTGLSYAKDTFFDNETYKGNHISKHTKLLLAEDEPYDDGEKKTYSEHLMLISARKAYDDTIEGDYLDILVFGTGDQILGWIEISGTWDGKLPSSRTIKTIETYADLLGIALSRDPSITGTELLGSDQPSKNK
jgi:hypothetical protein